MKNNNLFDGFEPFPKKDWIAKIEKDLKGKPYSDLVKNNVIGSVTQPVYTAEDLPSSAGYSLGTKNESNDWVVSEDFVLTEDGSTDNKSILNLLNKGLTGINLKGEPTKKTLEGIAPEYISTEFSNYSDLTLLTVLLQESFGKSDNTYPIYLNFDPITTAAQKGSWKSGVNQLKIGIESAKYLSHYKGLRVFSVGANEYHNCGAGAVSELGLALAQAHEYIVNLLENGVSIDDASAQIKIDLASGRDYFTELAKFRAIRILWSKMISAYSPKHDCSKSIIVKSYTSSFWNTVYDAHNNMLRATTQAMSAALGGADIISVTPYDSAWKNGDEFSKRVARNVQLLLKEESYFDKVIDPAAGSYFIENLTNELAEKAWTKFQKIEKKGGFLSLLESGNLHRELKEEAEQQIIDFESGAIKVIGVNLFPDPSEKAIHKLTELNNEPEALNASIDFPAIEKIRLVGKYEQQRITEEMEDLK